MSKTCTDSNDMQNAGASEIELLYSWLRGSCFSAKCSCTVSTPTRTARGPARWSPAWSCRVASQTWDPPLSTHTRPLFGNISDDGRIWSHFDWHMWWHVWCYLWAWDRELVRFDQFWTRSLCSCCRWWAVGVLGRRGRTREYRVSARNWIEWSRQWGRMAGDWWPDRQADHEFLWAWSCLWSRPSWLLLQGRRLGGCRGWWIGNWGRRVWFPYAAVVGRFNSIQ